MEKIIYRINYIRSSYEELSEEERKLTDAAKNATRGSYAPYSKFCVGAAALLADGTVIIGANQENAAYPSGLCAERTALFSAGATHPGTPVTALAIAAYTNGKFLSKPVTPCGSCRQVLAETEARFGTAVKIILYGTDYCLVFDKGSSDLLPFGFDEEYLDRP